MYVVRIFDRGVEVFALHAYTAEDARELGIMLTKGNGRISVVESPLPGFAACSPSSDRGHDGASEVCDVSLFLQAARRQVCGVLS